MPLISLATSSKRSTTFFEFAVDLAADHIGHGIAACAVAAEEVLETQIVKFVGAAFNAGHLFGDG